MAENDVGIPVGHRDVIVVGGGPAGTTAAALLARRGWAVVLFEREQHPKFHIGESLLPMNLPLFDELGVTEQVRAIGVYKPGADFTGPNGDQHHSFPFADALGDTPGHAYQVTRSELDALLFENCRAAGVDTRQRHRVDRIALAPGGRGRHRVAVARPDGVTEAWTCRYLVDASGQSTVLARQQGWRHRDRRHSAAAFFAHYRGVPPRDGGDAGNISIYWFDGGWIWMIPQRHGITSVGAVCRSELARGRAADKEAFLNAMLARAPAAAARMAGARRVAPVRTAANYSYASSTQTGPGYALVGDAYTFIDPVFSSGVYIAMSSASALAPRAELWLTGRRWRYRLSCHRYRRRVRRGLRAYTWFIYRFNTPAMGWLFGNPRPFFRVREAVISLLAGDVLDRPAIRARLGVFKLLYAGVSLLQRACPRAFERGG